ncbi:MAG: hypothetical protein Q7K40_05430 [bacterium]|nr:hypothetical protein [bacterium]
MQGIEFETDGSPESYIKRPLPPSGIIGFVMRLTKIDKATTNIVLLGTSIIFLGITFFLYAKILGNDAPPKQTSEQMAAQNEVLKKMQGSN